MLKSYLCRPFLSISGLCYQLTKLVASGAVSLSDLSSQTVPAGLHIYRMRWEYRATTLCVTHGTGRRQTQQTTGYMGRVELHRRDLFEVLAPLLRYLRICLEQFSRPVLYLSEVANILCNCNLCTYQAVDQTAIIICFQLVVEVFYDDSLDYTDSAFSCSLCQVENNIIVLFCHHFTFSLVSRLVLCYSITRSSSHFAFYADSFVFSKRHQDTSGVPPRGDRVFVSSWYILQFPVMAENISLSFTRLSYRKT